MKSNSNIAQEITDSIITQLEQGVAPWVKPWSNRDLSAPHNPASGTYYRGANFFWLTMLSSSGVYGSSNIWMTYAQAQKMGAQVTSKAKGKGVQVIFYKPLTIQGALNPETMQHDSKVIPMLKTYTVFNADFIDGLPVDDIEPVPVNEFQSIEECERFIASTGATIKHGGNNAFYAPDSDYIQLPEKTAFNTNADYYSTVLHELSHWTGHKSRLDRDFSKSKRFGDNAYAFEELVAELGSAMLCAHLRIDGKLQHANYLGSWLKVLKADSKAILKASAEAQKILDKLTKHEELGEELTEELKVA